MWPQRRAGARQAEPIRRSGFEELSCDDPTRGAAKGQGAMHENPKFWALFVALFVMLYLAMVNIITKVNLLLDLTAHA
jgi:hypothetical protein